MLVSYIPIIINFNNNIAYAIEVLKDKVIRIITLVNGCCNSDGTKVAKSLGT